MIIVLCTDDDALVKYAEAACGRQPEVFGQCYRAFRDQIPPLAQAESLFISAHGTYDGDDGNPVIGDKRNAHYWNAVQAVQALESIFPPGSYAGNVYISACEASEHKQDGFSFAEVFKAQLERGPGGRGTQRYTGTVYGQSGSVGLRVPAPTDPGWKRA